MIRTVQENDKTDIGNIYCETWKYAYRGIVPSEYLDSLTIENCTPRDILPHNNLLAEIDNKVVGTINFGMGREASDLSYGEIRSIYVLPEFYDRGIGRELFSSALLRLQEKGYQRIYLWVLKDNTRARKFYEKMGMTCTNIEKVITISGKELVEIKYEYHFHNKIEKKGSNDA